MTKGDVINYLVDVLGNSEEEANKIFSLYGTTYFSPDELKECVEFNK